jgi:Immunity protein 26/Double zinc ribbon
MPKFKTGDLFAIKISEGEYVNGRVLLDVKRQCIKPRLVKPDSALGFFNGAILVETYRETFAEPTARLSEVLIPGTFVDTYALESGKWQVLGNVGVEPTRVEFPEALVGSGYRSQFLRGEVSLPLSLSGEDRDEINVLGTINPSGMLGDTCLYYLGRKDEITKRWVNGVETASLAHSDLRFSKYRSEVYRLLGEDEGQSYFEMAMRHGYDIRRFYPNAAVRGEEGLEVSEDGTLTLCPYCLSPIDREVKLCPHCKQDTTLDARVVRDVEAYRDEERTTCRHCGASMLDLATHCPACGKSQR